MPDPATLLVVASLASSVLFKVNRSFWERRRARRALRRVAVLDASATEGTRVRVTGIVRALDRTVTAPLTGRSCVVFRSRVSTQRGRAGKLDQPMLCESFDIVPFEIELPGDAGRVVILGAAAVLDVAPMKIGWVTSERRQQLALHVGAPPRGTRRQSFEEVVVEPGMQVTVAGVLMKDAGDAPARGAELAYRDAAPAAMLLTGNFEHPLAIGAAIT